jgi:hypothetical protein
LLHGWGTWTINQDALYHEPHSAYVAYDTDDPAYWTVAYDIADDGDGAPGKAYRIRNVDENDAMTLADSIEEHFDAWRTWIHADDEDMQKAWDETLRATIDDLRLLRFDDTNPTSRVADEAGDTVDTHDIDALAHDITDTVKRMQKIGYAFDNLAEPRVQTLRAQPRTFYIEADTKTSPHTRRTLFFAKFEPGLTNRITANPFYREAHGVTNYEHVILEDAVIRWWAARRDRQDCSIATASESA